MERLTIDEIIAHCKRIVRKKEALNGRDFFETESTGHYPMQEYWEHRQVAEYLEELLNYRKAEEQGLLLRLPCPVGTTVYNTTWWDSIEECVKVNGKPYFRTERKHKVSKSTFSVLDIEEFGKTVFLTKEEAEATLAEKGGA
jgi:hypothetical protein